MKFFASKVIKIGVLTDVREKLIKKTTDFK